MGNVKAVSYTGTALSPIYQTFSAIGIDSSKGTCPGSTVGIGYRVKACLPWSVRLAGQPSRSALRRCPAAGSGSRRRHHAALASRHSSRAARPAAPAGGGGPLFVTVFAPLSSGRRGQWTRGGRLAHVRRPWPAAAEGTADSGRGGTAEGPVRPRAVQAASRTAGTETGVLQSVREPRRRVGRCAEPPDSDY